MDNTDNNGLLLAALMVIAFLFFQIRPSHGEIRGVITDQLTLGFSRPSFSMM